MNVQPEQSVVLPQGTIFYQESGSGPPIVFVHGLLVNSNVWCYIMPELSQQFRCIAPDLPMGAHTQAVAPDADLSPPGMAKLVADFIEALDLHDVTLVGNDTGGAISQLVITNHPEHIERLVLFNADAFENFLPPVFRMFQWLPRIPGGTTIAAQLFRPRIVQRITMKMLSKAGTTSDMLDMFFGRFVREPRIRRDAGKVLATISNRYTLEAANKFSAFNKPVLIAWGSDDFIFPKRYATRLTQAFPNAELKLIPNARTFVQFDQPALLTALIRDFIHQWSYRTS
ncbi:MAG: alpha/beta hydrolase [Chloroflexota bacterium]